MQNDKCFNKHQYWLGAWHFFFLHTGRGLWFPIVLLSQMQPPNEDVWSMSFCSRQSHLYNNNTCSCRQGLTKNYILIIILSTFHLPLENKQSLWSHDNEPFHSLDSPETYNKNNKSRPKSPGTTKVLKLYLITRTSFKSGHSDNNNDRIRA